MLFVNIKIGAKKNEQPRRWLNAQVPPASPNYVWLLLGQSAGLYAKQT